MDEDYSLTASAILIMEQGTERMEDIRYAVLVEDGEISIIPIEKK